MVLLGCETGILRETGRSATAAQISPVYGLVDSGVVLSVVVTCFFLLTGGTFTAPSL